MASPNSPSPPRVCLYRPDESSDTPMESDTLTNANTTVQFEFIQLTEDDLISEQQRPTEYTETDNFISVENSKSSDSMAKFNTLKKLLLDDSGTDSMSSMSEEFGYSEVSESDSNLDENLEKSTSASGTVVGEMSESDDFSSSESEGDVISSDEDNDSESENSELDDPWSDLISTVASWAGGTSSSRFSNRFLTGSRSDDSKLKKILVRRDFIRVKLMPGRAVTIVPVLTTVGFLHLIIFLR